MREQGFMVLKGNPKNIRGVEDLLREDVMFINRQSGAGTRVLLDYCLDQAGLDPEGNQGLSDGGIHSHLRRCGGVVRSG